MKVKQKILCICRIFPPEGGSAVQRPVKFVKYLPQFNWQPFVVTCRDHFVLIGRDHFVGIPSREKEWQSPVPSTQARVSDA